MKFGTPSHADEAHFDITAMIDIVLLLIIFFSFTTHFSRTMATPMNLPGEKGEAPTTSGEASSVTIDLTKTGQMLVMGREVDGVWLLQTLSKDVRAAGGGEHLEVIVRADRDCPAVHLNALAGSLAAVGVRNWKLATAGEGG